MATWAGHDQAGQKYLLSRAVKPRGAAGGGSDGGTVGGR